LPDPGAGVTLNRLIMALREILEYPDPRLREVGKPVQQVDDEIRTLCEDMAETMYAAPGVGLAATQIGVPLRIFVIDIAAEDEPSDLRVFINPEIYEKDGVLTWNEGCLSFPGISEEIKRANHVRVRALDVNGKPFDLEAEGLLAVAIQHENDHLDGVLMIDKVSALKKRMMSRKLAKRQKDDSANA
jgi:peptide deformylase